MYHLTIYISYVCFYVSSICSYVDSNFFPDIGLHLFSQPIAAHTTHNTTLGFAGCDLYAFDSLVKNSGLGTRTAGPVGWRGIKSLIGLNDLEVGWYLLKRQYWTHLKRFS